MNILIDGTSLSNKGAELMAISIIKYIEKKWPESIVYYKDYDYLAKKGSFDSKLKIKYVNKSFYRLLNAKFHIQGILKRLGINKRFLHDRKVLKKIDVLIDAGGFQFGDNWDYSEDYAKAFAEYYEKYSIIGTKIIFLPQSVGTLESNSSKIIVKSLIKNSSKFFPRDIESKENLLKAGYEKTLNIYPDFTAMLETPNIGKIDLKKVVFIPNNQMLRVFGTRDAYIQFCNCLIEYLLKKDYRVEILNHENNSDRTICQELSRTNKLKLFDSLSVTQIREYMANSYIVITGRFHGLANSLNLGIPSLATSWNVKYENLFSDYEVASSILTPENMENNYLLLDKYLDGKTNNEIRSQLLSGKKKILKQNQLMWDEIQEVIEVDNGN